jgi:hypothetical protein
MRVEIIWIAKVIDPFLTDMKAAAPFAVDDNESAILSGGASGSVPDFQSNTVLMSGTTVAVKSLATGSIAAS